MREIYDVITMGSATQDVFAQTDAETITIRHHHEREELIAYPLGSKILIETLDFQIGGGGTNTATTFARFGLKTGYIGKLGRDTGGYAVLAFLKEEGIDFLGAVGRQTGYSIILDSEEEDRTILTFKGCNNLLKEKELNLPPLQAKWLYCSSMMGSSFATMKGVMRTLKERGSRVAFNPSCYQAEQGLDALRDALSLTDVLILNKEEAALLGDAATLREAGPGSVIITDGAQGCTLHDGEGRLHASAAPKLDVVETTGAGDAFASGFVAALALGFDREKALRAGMVNAEHVIAEYGAKNHILTREELEGFLKHDERELRGDAA